MTLDEIKSIIRPKVVAFLTQSGAVVGSSITREVGADGTVKNEVSLQLGNHSPKDEAVEKFTALLSESIYAILPELKVSVTITTSTGVEGKGTGTVE